MNEGMEGKVVEWVVEDELGVFVTIRSLPNTSNKIQHVKLKFITCQTR